MVLEPNCSILAACLPTFGPLVAGGRGPESIVRSVRSIFSLRSLRGSGSAIANGSGGSRPSRRNYVQNGEAGLALDSLNMSESQAELHRVQDWPGKGHQEISITGNSAHSLSGHEEDSQGICVTNGVTVHTQ